MRASPARYRAGGFGDFEARDIAAELSRIRNAAAAEAGIRAADGPPAEPTTSY